MALSFLESLINPESETGSDSPLYSMLLPLVARDRVATEGGRASQGGGGGGPVADGDVEAMVKRMAARKYGWTGNQWKALHDLVMKESGFNPTAQNPTSSAYGIFQFLDSTRSNYGLSKGAGPRKQTKAGLKYVADRYGDPRSALNFHLKNNWY
jgi:hypothetical protein